MTSRALRTIFRKSLDLVLVVQYVEINGPAAMVTKPEAARSAREAVINAT